MIDFKSKSLAKLDFFLSRYWTNFVRVYKTIYSNCRRFLIFLPIPRLFELENTISSWFLTIIFSDRLLILICLSIYFSIQILHKILIMRGLGGSARALIDDYLKKLLLYWPTTNTFLQVVSTVEKNCRIYCCVFDRNINYRISLI